MVEAWSDRRGPGFIRFGGGAYDERSGVEWSGTLVPYSQGLERLGGDRKGRRTRCLEIEIEILCVRFGVFMAGTHGGRSCVISRVRGVD